MRSQSSQKVKSVQFALEDRSEKMMVEYLERNNIKFSPFVKRLIWTYMHQNGDKLGEKVAD